MQKKSMITKKIAETGSRISQNRLLSDISIMIIMCFAGVVVKKMINPFANMITDSLHVPGGISTAFSLMFLVIAAGVTSGKWNASIMGSMQALTALSLGMVGRMGILMPLAYLIPGIVIDLVMLIPGERSASIKFKAFIANIFSSVSAALFADVVVFHLPLKPLLVYICLAVLSGAICGFIAGAVLDSIKNRKSANDHEEVK